jgi:hypothetical protein
MLLPIVAIALAVLISLAAAGCKKSGGSSGGGGYGLGTHHRVPIAARSA